MASPGHPASRYSKQELVSKLKGGDDGIAAWNKWLASLSDEERKKVDLTGADLSECRLANADLWGINLRRAVLWDATLTNVFKTNLRETDLCGADLSAAKGGLLSDQLAGADLTGAKLPESLAKLYDKLGSVSDISDSAKKLFLALLAACLYSWLTIATTKDVDLITNRASSPLPVIQTAIPIVGFYVVAPLILLCIYFYFHFYLQKLWEELATLPAVFTDGRPLYARADPWLFNDLVRAHFPRLRQGRPFLSYFQQWISVLLAWWIVPVTLLLFWGRYLPRHDLFWTIVLALLLAISVVSAIRLYQLASSTLRGDRRLTLSESIRSRHPWVILALVCVCSAVFVMMSLGAIDGIPVEKTTFHRAPRTWVPFAMSWVGYHPFVDVENDELSIKPADWTDKKDDELDRVKGAALSKTNLEYAYADNAFLAKAELVNSNLQFATLSHSDLRNANLSLANLSQANLLGAQMDGADISNAHLENTDLSNAHLKGAKLLFTSLIQADFTEADLSCAVFLGANLSGAKLRDTTLVGTDFGQSDLDNAYLMDAEIKYANLRNARHLNLNSIKDAKDWNMAFYDPDMLNQLGLLSDHNEALEDYQKSGSQEPFDSWQERWRKKKEKTAARPK